ncbi:hypothetical protein GC197_09980 [bacterium]|nr:hypothetical protein [bacterium]
MLLPSSPHESSGHSPSGGGSHTWVFGVVVVDIGEEPELLDEVELLLELEDVELLELDDVEVLELDEERELEEDELDEGCVLLELEDDGIPEEDELDEETPEEELDVEEELGTEELLVLDDEELA